MSVGMTAKLKQPFGEGALLSNQCEVEKVERIIHDGQQFFQCPPLHHSLQSVLFTANHRASVPDEFVEFVGVAASGAAHPTNYSKEKYTGHHRLIKDLQHLAAHIEGSQLPQDV